uniref:Nucleotidyl transferase AbiEii/AbiGii toxin family protein n=1 Tax=candidate division WOR-3 bacterium TaxID=2052148 RepID=A0A7C6EFG3_UNCW3
MINPRFLPKQSQRVFKILTQLPIWDDFYIGGGTGLILRFGHRLSADFDLFSPTNRLSSPERRLLYSWLKKAGKTVVESTREGSFRLTFEGVTLGFFYYDYPLIAPLERYGKVKVASLEDIALMKIAAIIGRGSKKDFVDLYFILKKGGIGLAKLLSLARKKFPHVRDVAIQALQALTYFTDAETETIQGKLKMAKPIAWQKIKSFLISEVTKYARAVLGIK